MRVAPKSGVAWSAVAWPSPNPQTPEQQPNGDSKGSKTKEIWPLMLLWVFMAVFTILYAVYIYRTLLSGDPGIGNILPSASDTNLVVSILSQVFANMVDMLLTGVFDVLRWQLAARFAGISATTFFQLSSSTQWIPVFFLTITKLSRGGVGLIRYWPWVCRYILPADAKYTGSCCPCLGSSSGAFSNV
jgi:hypothetical protein